VLGSSVVVLGVGEVVLGAPGTLGFTLGLSIRRIS